MYHYFDHYNYSYLIVQYCSGRNGLRACGRMTLPSYGRENRTMITAGLHHTVHGTLTCKPHTVHGTLTCNGRPTPYSTWHINLKGNYPIKVKIPRQTLHHAQSNFPHSMITLYTIMTLQGDCEVTLTSCW